MPATLSTKVGNNLTVEAWVYSNTITSSAYRGIVSDAYTGDGNVQFELFLDGTPSRLSAGFFGGSWYQTGESAAFPLNQWVHVAASYDGQKIRVYRGGVKVAESAALNRSLPVGTSGWRIGARHDSIYSSTVWNGKLDNVAIYARTLPEAEIAAHAALHDGVGDACDPCPDSGDPACRPTTCTDDDGDGYGVQGASNCAAGRPELFDCNDAAASIHPGAVDVQWDGADNDCNGYPDEPMQEMLTYQWDGNGNLVGDGREWDARDRLVSGGFGYDTGNLRVKMGEQKVLLDGIEEAREYGVEAKRYDHDPSRVDGLLAQKTGAGKGYFVTDALGSVYGVVDASGAVVSRYGYDVYGARTASGEGMATAWGFTGRRHDNPTLLYNRDRYREPTGFMAKDSRLLVAADNSYSYANSNPISLADPSGRYVVLQDGETSTAIFGGYQTRQGVGKLEDYDFSVGLSATPTGQKVYNDVESSLIRATVGWLGSQGELIGEFGGAAGFLDEDLQSIFNDAASSTGSTYMELDPCSGPSPLRAFRVYWFPNSIAQFNRNFFHRGWFQSPAEVVAHELAHVRSGLWLASVLSPMSYDDWVTFLRIASNDDACSVSAAVHAELYGDGFTSRSQVPCSHSR